MDNLIFNKQRQKARLTWQMLRHRFALSVSGRGKARDVDELLSSYEGLISPIIRKIYYRSYISNVFNVEAKLEVLSHQYRLLRQQFSESDLKQLFSYGFVLWDEELEGQCFQIRLHHTSEHIREGALGLNFIHDNKSIFNLTFTIMPGRLLGLNDRNVVYVSRIQYEINIFDRISEVTKTLGEITPMLATLYVLEGIAKASDISAIIGVGAKNQIKYVDSSDKTLFGKNYDPLWTKMDGVQLGQGDYMITCPFVRKPLSDIKQKHRSRTLAKRARQSAISNNAYGRFSQLLKAEE